MTCPCHRCVEEREAHLPLTERVFGRRMILCAVCGNKRCPHAADHRNACTNSNETGQKGSLYESVLPLSSAGRVANG